MRACPVPLLPSSLTVLAVSLALALGAPVRAEAPPESWQIEAPRIAFDDKSPLDRLNYHPLERAERPWQLCVLYPHLKDAYWLSVNFGMVEEAARLGVGFNLFEAGGYPNLERQREQLLAWAAVSWVEMGAVAGRFLADRHPAGSPAVRIAWFPGPEAAGWVGFVEEGFRSAIRDSAVEVVATFHGDTGREQQVLLVEEALDRLADIDYLVGSGPTAEVAVSILRARGLEDRIGIVSTYMSHAVFRGIRRGRILAAPTDFAVMQGRLSVEMAVRALEGRLEVAQAGPVILAGTPETVDEIGSEGSLAPATFEAVFAFSGDHPR